MLQNRFYFTCNHGLRRLYCRTVLVSWSLVRCSICCPECTCIERGSWNGCVVKCLGLSYRILPRRDSFVTVPWSLPYNTLINFAVVLGSFPRRSGGSALPSGANWVAGWVGDYKLPFFIKRYLRKYNRSDVEAIVYVEYGWSLMPILFFSDLDFPVSGSCRPKLRWGPQWRGHPVCISLWSLSRRACNNNTFSVRSVTLFFIQISFTDVLETVIQCHFNPSGSFSVILRTICEVLLSNSAFCSFKSGTVFQWRI